MGTTFMMATRRQSARWHTAPFRSGTILWCNHIPTLEAMISFRDVQTAAGLVEWHLLFDDASSLALSARLHGRLRGGRSSRARFGVLVCSKRLRRRRMPLISVLFTRLCERLAIPRDRI